MKTELLKIQERLRTLQSILDDTRQVYDRIEDQLKETRQALEAVKEELEK